MKRGEISFSISRSSFCFPPRPPPFDAFRVSYPTESHLVLETAHRLDARFAPRIVKKLDEIGYVGRIVHVAKSLSGIPAHQAVG